MCACADCSDVYSINPNNPYLCSSCGTSVAYSLTELEKIQWVWMSIQES